LAGERNKRHSERRGGRDVEKRTKQVMQRAAPRARRRQEKEWSDSARDTAGKKSVRASNE
jgi:hypothetical protein